MRGYSKIAAWILLALSLHLTPLAANIVDIHKIEQVGQYLAPETLVIFDIDNTLIEPVQELGNDQWFQHRMSQLRASGLSEKLALQQAVLDWEAIRNVTQMKLVEETARDLIKNFQNKNVQVMGLTTQSFSLALRTINHLEKLDVDLQKTAPSQEDLVYKTTYPILYMNGILFTGEQTKDWRLNDYFL